MVIFFCFFGLARSQDPLPSWKKKKKKSYISRDWESEREKRQISFVLSGKNLSYIRLQSLEQAKGVSAQYM